MARPYKLTDEIKQFIIQNKKDNPHVSCRGLISLIKERFQVELSKSLINNVIKEQDLSAPVGRRKEKEEVPELPSPEVPKSLPEEEKKELLPEEPEPSPPPAPEPPPPPPPPSEGPVIPVEQPIEEEVEPPEQIQPPAPPEPPPQSVPEPSPPPAPEPPPPPPAQEPLPASEKPPEMPPEMPKKPLEIAPIKPVRQEADFMENGGLFLLKTADIKLGLTPYIADILYGHMPGLAKEDHRAIIEALIYGSFFKDKGDLWLLIGKYIPDEDITKYSQYAAQVPFSQLKESFVKLGISDNINNINELWKEVLIRLNAFITQFFPPEFHSLDFPAMRERFYSLPARLQTTGNLLMLQHFYPPGFFWLNDVIWQEGFSCAAQRVNEAKIQTHSGLQIWISTQVQFI